MKKLITILLLTALTSCGVALEPPKSNTDYKNIIGKTIKIGNLEVAKYDFPDKINWYGAYNACARIGDGWRLPTQDELNTLYQNKNEIGNFSEDKQYWSSTLSWNDDNMWLQFFDDGSQKFSSKDLMIYVRAVRSL